MKRRHQNGREYFRSSFLFFVSALLVSFTSYTSHSEENPYPLAVIGDSISTGAVSQGKLKFQKQALWDVLRGNTDVSPDPQLFKEQTGLDVSLLPTPQRLWPTPFEFFGFADWYGQHAMIAFSSLYLDTEEYSWASLLGAKLNLTRQPLLIAAQDGAKMRDGIRQIDRLLAVTGGILPKKLFIFFTGNDLCGATMNQLTSAAEFKEQLELTIEHLANYGKTTEDGSDVYIVGYLGTVQLTTNPEILTKKVPAYNQVLSCAELGKGELPGSAPKDDLKFYEKSPEAGLIMNLLPDHPGAMCPTLYGQNFDNSKDQKSTLANRIRAFRKQSVDLVTALNRERMIKGLRLHYVADTERLNFVGEDIANDCFHLSLTGQNKLAKTVYESITRL